MKTFDIFGITITKITEYKENVVIQKFTFSYQGIECEIMCWAYDNDSHITSYHKKYHGYGETWNHAAYVILSKKQMEVLSPSSFEYPANIFQKNEVTYTAHIEDDKWKVGIDYHHCWNDAKTTDLLVVFSELIDEVEVMALKLR